MGLEYHIRDIMPHFPKLALALAQIHAAVRLSHGWDGLPVAKGGLYDSGK